MNIEDELKKDVTERMEILIKEKNIVNVTVPPLEKSEFYIIFEKHEEYQRTKGNDEKDLIRYIETIKTAMDKYHGFTEGEKEWVDWVVTRLTLHHDHRLSSLCSGFCEKNGVKIDPVKQEILEWIKRKNQEINNEPRR
jgi:hypothetical protein